MSRRHCRLRSDNGGATLPVLLLLFRPIHRSALPFQLIIKLLLCSILFGGLPLLGFPAQQGYPGFRVSLDDLGSVPSLDGSGSLLISTDAFDVVRLVRVVALVVCDAAGVSNGVI